MEGLTIKKRLVRVHLALTRSDLFYCLSVRRQPRQQNRANDDIDQNINIGTQGERTINIGSSSATKVDFGAGKIDNYSANVETGTTESNALAIGASYNGTVLLIADDSAVQTLTLADDLPVGFNFMVVQKGNYKIKMAAATATDLVGQGITNGTSGYIWSNGKYSVVTIVVIADGEYVMTGDRSNSAS